MEYNEILTTLGTTQSRLEGIIIFTIIAIGIGIVCVLYWKFLMAGFFALVLLFVFSRHESTTTEVVAKTIEPTEVVEIDNKFNQKRFMEDCLSLASRESLCEELWKQRSQ